MENYLRFGEIPENERSGIYDGDLGKISEEIGVSVYNVIKKKGVYNILLPMPIKQGHIFDLSGFLETRNKYLLNGDEVGIGSNGEPLLINVKVIKKI